MQTITRKSVDKKIKTKEKPKDELTSKVTEEKQKKSIYSVSTPRNFNQNSSATDIYSKRNSTIQSVKAPKKLQKPVNKTNNESPMKNVLKSSSVTQISGKSKSETPSLKTTVKDREKPNITNRNKLPINVTVNSPIVKRKLNLEREPTTDSIKVKNSKTSKEVKTHKNSIEVTNTDIEHPQRQRTKTRTLDDDEVKVLKANIIDNNAEMLNLTKKLSAKPKAFYVDLNNESKPVAPKSDDEVSYEDDFESYESDFESYKSSHTDTSSSGPDDKENEIDNGTDDTSEVENATKEEGMLDSGHFDLREPHSASQIKPMDFILESSEENDKKISFTDEGFQEMSSSSGFSSMKTVHVDVLDRPLFIDFTKSKADRRKRRVFERLKQRAKDILSMVTLHEMSYTLFEMPPIPYDLYMATYGRLNYTQVGVQTFDDGVTVEVQTDDIEHSNRWTQHPIDFSKNTVCLNLERKNIKNDDFNYEEEEENNTLDDDYKNNALRIYLEQQNGAGSDQIMPYDKYKDKLRNNHYSVSKLRRFLKKVESKISNVLSVNAGNTDMTNIFKTSKFPFSDGFVSLSPKSFSGKYTFLKHLKIIGVVFSDTKSNLLMTIHKKSCNGIILQKCILCLWNLSVAILHPLKVLIATDDVKLGLFRGNIDGIFIGGLIDGSIHLWDLSEEATWCANDTGDKKSTTAVEIHSSNLTTTEKDREWNLRNRDVVYEKKLTTALQTCAFTSSAHNIIKNETVDSIVGMEFIGNASALNMDSGKIIGQICVLQQIGILTIWSILQEKSKALKPDMGKSVWSRIMLEKNQTIDLSDHGFGNIADDEIKFDLIAAKKRLATKRTERNCLKMERCFSKEVKNLPSSSVASSQFERPMSAASSKNSRILIESSFQNTAICNCLKVMIVDRTVNFLVAKNCGQVECFTKVGSMVKHKTIKVSSKVTLITHIEVSPHGLPYFLAATDCGTIHLCSLLDSRVLLTLDSRNIPVTVGEKYHGDIKGRFAGSYETTTKDNLGHITSRINSLVWSHGDPFCIIALLPKDSLGVWELTHSDIHAKCLKENVAIGCAATDRALALITPDNEVQVYKLLDQQNRLDLFMKYVALL